ncbi:hypothetical protein A8950_2645 [Dongia mobilis]|uniref:PAS domain-containing protein n=1 Tax=Dongia mobilis TaxID=578943 RepID=A0A4R6WLX2_9PROT|nr:PAS domain-containing protein [Dongia mobilis]TDQ81576.1 hypothetical protein A8950_2645 [Dongia mobilis]
MNLPSFVRAMDIDGDILAADLRAKPRALLDLWQGWRTGDAGPPRKSAIDPVELARARLMPDIWLIVLLPDGRFQFSLSGENLNALFNTTLRGKTVEETFDPATAAFANQRYRRIICDEVAEFSRGPVTCDGKPSYYAYRLILPLVTDDGASRFAIGVAESEEFNPLADPDGERRYFFDEIIMTPVGRIGI